MASLWQRLAADEKTANFFGIGVRALKYSEFYECIDSWLSNKHSHRSYHIALINAFCAVSTLSDERLLQIYNRADLIVPDGRPFIYWMKALLKRPCRQFDGPGMVTKLIQRASKTGYTFYFYGGHPNVLEKMKIHLEKSYPHIKIVGYTSPPFRALTKQEDKEICDEINRIKPDFLCIGLGTPKQDYWIDDHISKIKGTIMLPCGALFDFFGGRIKRAPAYIQILGLEWLHRLFSKDFSRLFRRYTILNGKFLLHLFYQVIGKQVRYPSPIKRA